MNNFTKSSKIKSSQLKILDPKSAVAREQVYLGKTKFKINIIPETV